MKKGGKCGTIIFGGCAERIGPYTAADNERGDDVGGCTASWEFRRSMSGLKSGGEKLQKTRVSRAAGVKVSGCPEN